MPPSQEDNYKNCARESSDIPSHSIAVDYPASPSPSKQFPTPQLWKKRKASKLNITTVLIKLLI